MTSLRISLIYSFLAISTTLVAQAQDEPKPYQAAIASIDRELEVELKKLAEIRKTISAEKPDVAKKAAESALLIRQKKRQFEVAKATQASVDHQLVKREEQLKLWSDERNYIDGLLDDFSKSYRSLIPRPQADAMEEAFQKAAGEGAAGTSASLDLAEQLIADLSEMGTVQVREGSALDLTGTMVSGKFAIAGPLSWFMSDDATISGLSTESRSLTPEVVANTGAIREIGNLTTGGPAEVSFDPTLGSAIAMDQIEGDVFSYIKKGGLWVYPILALALLALIAAIVKWVQLLGIREIRPSMVQLIVEKIHQGDNVAAAETVEKIKHPAKSLLETGIYSVGQPIDDVEESIYQRYLEAIPRLQRGLPLIAIASATAPLLGLLGTVTGMIKTFNQITIFGTGDAKSLSGGISEALITTAFGLIVAIPALILHAFLSRKIQGIRATMEMVSLAFINGLKRK